MTACFWVKNILTDQRQKNKEIPNCKEEVFVPYKHQISILVIAIIEFCQKLCFPGFFSFLEVSHDMGRLLPQVMSFFKLHFTLRKKRTYKLMIDQTSSETIKLSISQSVCVSVCVSLYIFVYPSVCQSVHWFISSSIHLFISQSVKKNFSFEML